MSASRSELERLWRKRVGQAHEQYMFEAKICKALLAERVETFPNILPPDPDGTLALHQAFQRESGALNEYMRVLKIYTDLVIQGKTPPTEADHACGVGNTLPADRRQP
ncbi:MAG: hypothetical protein WBY44_04210 [Bryobacteraceae bacterium]